MKAIDIAVIGLQAGLSAMLLLPIALLRKKMLWFPFTPLVIGTHIVGDLIGIMYLLIHGLLGVDILYELVDIQLGLHIVSSTQFVLCLRYPKLRGKTLLFFTILAPFIIISFASVTRYAKADKLTRMALMILLDALKAALIIFFVGLNYMCAHLVKNLIVQLMLNSHLISLLFNQLTFFVSDICILHEICSEVYDISQGSTPQNAALRKTGIYAHYIYEFQVVFLQLMFLIHVAINQRQQRRQAVDECVEMQEVRR